MTLSEFMGTNGLTDDALAKRVEVSRPYITKVRRGAQPPSKRVAVRIWRETGVKLGPLAGKSDDEISVFARFVEVAA